MGASEFPGVEVRRGKNKSTLRIVFYWRGVRHREALDLADTPKNRKRAYGIKLEVEEAIRRGTFDYAATFPNSKQAVRQVAGAVKPTIRELLRAYETMIAKAVVLGNVSPSTQEGYRKVILGHLLPAFGETRIDALSSQQLRGWISGIGATGKTVRNILTPLRAILADAVNDDVIKANPLDRIELDRLLSKTAKRSTYEVDPFNAAEMTAILEQCSEPQERNLFQFAFWSGLRTSELIALAWPHIDFVNSMVRVRQALVRRQVKTTKTESGQRDVMLLPQALAALQAQKAHTFIVGERVFYDARYGRAWGTDSDIKKRWMRILKRAGVRYRNAYQTRHTYASMLLSRGENPLWVAKQMGHKDTEMITRHYGKWIPDLEAKGGYALKGAWK